MHHTIATLLSSALLVAGCSGTAADTSSTPPTVAVPTDTELGSPTKTQFEAGASLYGQHCASCHGASGEGAAAPMLVGEGALPRVPPQGRVHRTGQFATVHDVFEFVRATMPPDDPTVLSDDDVWAIVAFDLTANGIELSAPLTAEGARAMPLQ